MYSVKFVDRGVRFGRRLWHWEVMFRKNKVVARGRIEYTSKKSAMRAFRGFIRGLWKIEL